MTTAVDDVSDATGGVVVVVGGLVMVAAVDEEADVVSGRLAEVDATPVLAVHDARTSPIAALSTTRSRGSRMPVALMGYASLWVGSWRCPP